MENVKENGTKIRIVTVFNIISPLSNQGAFSISVPRYEVETSDFFRCESYVNTI